MKAVLEIVKLSSDVVTASPETPCGGTYTPEIGGGCAGDPEDE